MLKKLITLATAVTFVSVLASPVAAAASKQPVPLKTGTITSWDAATKRGVVKDDKGVETSFVWNETTKFNGTAKVGEHAYVWFKTDQDGKATATQISFGTRLVMKNAYPEKPLASPPAK